MQQHEAKPTFKSPLQSHFQSQILVVEDVCAGLVRDASVVNELHAVLNVPDWVGEFL